MFIPPTPSWHELALLALACWAATAAREVKAAEVPARPAQRVVLSVEQAPMPELVTAGVPLRPAIASA